jgi:hypothetical protein
MPCGGIYPVERAPNDCPVAEADRCWYCGKTEPKADHFVEEWDCYIHGVCVAPFLETDEGKIVLGHKHVVVVEIDGERKMLHEEGQ